MNNLDLIQSYIKKYGSILIVDKQNIVKNFEFIQKNSPQSIISAVLKNDAYGFGINNIAPIFEKLTNHYFVATLSEAIIFRKLNAFANIYVLHGVLEGQEEEFVANNLIPVLNTLNQIKIYNDFAYKKNKKLACFLNFETGLNRLGLTKEETKYILENKDITKNLDILYAMSHLALVGSNKNEEPEATLNQYNKFITLTEHFKNTPRSLCASNALSLPSKYHFNMIRGGISFYGGNPEAKTKVEGLSEVLHIYTSILQVKKIKAGEGVGYDHIYKAPNDRVIAIVPIGYGDGLVKRATGNASVYINNIKCPVLGIISMDLTIIDITDIPTFLQKEGVVVEILGKNQTINQLTAPAGTNGCEVFNKLSVRYPVIYI
jgi:alanine racemase